MGDENKKEETTVAENENKDLIEEIAAIDSLGDDEPFDADSGKDDSEAESKDGPAEDDKKSETESKEETTDEEKTEKDKETPKETGDEKEEKDEKTDKVDKEDKIGKKGESAKDNELSQIDKLVTEIDRLSGLVNTGQPAAVKEEGAKDTEGKTDKEKTDELIDFVKDADMDDVASNPAIFNKILNLVVSAVRKQTAGQISSGLPDVVTTQVQQQTYYTGLADKFYSDNKDLKNVKQVVKACAQQLRIENPDWGIEKIYSETAGRTRTTLGMDEQEVEKDEDIPSIDDAAFGKTHGGSKTNLKQQRSSLQVEIDEL